jgi:four helix bundle protein
MAKRSSGELKTQLLIAQEIGYLNQMSSKELQLKVQKISAMIGALIKTLKGRR